MKKLLLSLVSMCLMPFFSGCTLPAYHLLQDAGQSYHVVRSNNFKHLLAINSYNDINKPTIVFIEGDGKPWQSYNKVAFEPTPDKPLLLEWFIAADFPAIYLGRPCYFKLNDPQCSPYWYTHGRYSKPVVNSLVQVLAEKTAEKNLVLVGHSGGGALAVLMAEQLSNVEGLITIAGNLQVNTWSEFHHYSSLIGSMDPILRDPLPRHIRQIHLYSPFDTIIQAEWIKTFSDKQLNSRLIELPVYGHDAAWRKYYSEFKKILLENTSGKLGVIID